MSQAKPSLRALAQSKKKIDSPLAKYNSVGQLFCVLCNAQVKNEMFWTGHVNGKSHKESLAQLKAKQQNTPSSLKRPAPTASEMMPPPKSVKFDDTLKPAPEKLTPVAQAERELRMMAGEAPQPGDKVNPREESLSEDAEDEAAAAPPPPPKPSLPQGFFDDPKEDAKARGVKFKDPQDAEWDKFVREIATEDIRSSEIVVEDQEESAVVRELEQIEEQMVQWQRVIDLEKKAVEWSSRSSLKQKSREKMDTGEEEDGDGDEDDDEDNGDYDEDLDWRNKKR